MTAPNLSALRLGVPYDSLESTALADARTGAVLAHVSQINAGAINRDLRRIHEAGEALRQHSVQALLQICEQAADLFLAADLPLGVDVQTPDEYVAAVSATCGLPRTLARANMDKIHHVLQHMPDVLRGLTRDLDLRVLDDGIVEQNDLLLSFCPAAHSLGIVLPNNSPGVNGLWLPRIPLKIPVLVKPGSADPWTPWRIIQALMRAGCPPEAFCFYPAGHEGAEAVLSGSGRAIVFGDHGTVDKYAANPAISVHGPGFSKILVGGDYIDAFEDYLDVLVDSILSNGGRSCVNASTIVVPSRGRELADALAARLAAIEALPLEDENAQLAAWLNPAVAEGVDARLDRLPTTAGAVDVTAERRAGERRVRIDGLTYLLPTLVYCETREHPLARTEFMFPFAAVVEVPREEMAEWIGPTLVASAITGDKSLMARLLACPHIDRLNLGPIATPTVGWDQPHEGNLFEFLYQRRAIQSAL